MSTTHMNTHDAHEADAHHDEHHDTGGNTVFGFWIYLMTDCLLFASVFATYAVLFMNTAGGVSGKEIFELDFVLVETAALLVSSITYGFAMICAHSKNKKGTGAWLVETKVHQKHPIHSNRGADPIDGDPEFFHST